MASTSESRVSVIIAAHNRPELLAEGVASVASQSYPAYETIVVDDGSTPPLDLTPLQDAGGASVRIKRNDTPQRTAGAKNVGIQAATGDLITFLDDDDLFAPTYIETAVRILDEHPHIDVLFMGVSWFGKLASHGEKAYQEGMTKIFQETKTEEVEPGVFVFGDDLYSSLLQRVPMAFQRTVVRRKAFDRIGLFWEGCAIQDCDWAIRAARVAPCAVNTEGLYLQRTEGQGAASRPERKESQAIARIDIIERLLNAAADSPIQSGEEVILKQTLASAWFDLAYHYMQMRNAKASIKALLKSQRWRHTPKRWRLLGRLVLNSVVKNSG